MRMIQNLLELLLMVRPLIGGNPLSAKMLSKVVVLVIWSVIAGMMACLLILGGFYAIYRLGVFYGLGNDVAMLVTGGVVLICLLIALAVISCTLRKMRTGLKTPMSRVNHIADSFLKGIKQGVGQPR